jgi:hypothetical protein
MRAGGKKNDADEKTGVGARGRATPIVEVASSSDADLMFSATLMKGIETHLH